jgi:hypothetical protein
MDVAGFGTGIVNQTFAAEPGAKELLSAFWLRFTRDDHPVEHVSVYPKLIGNEVEFALADRDPTSWDDEYFYRVVTQSVVDSEIIEREWVQSVAVGNNILIDTEAVSRGPGFAERFVTVLRGFKFNYFNDDYAIKKIGIQGNSAISGMAIDFHDRSGLNKFGATVGYAFVPRTLISSQGFIEGESGAATYRDVPPGRLVLSGFSLEFVNDDFRILEMGVFSYPLYPTGPRIEIYFSDRGLQNAFRYRVDYAILS